MEGLLILRGLIPDPARQPQAEPAPAVPAATPAPAPRPRPVVDAPPLDPSERLRQELKALALRASAKPQGPERTEPAEAAVRPTRARWPGHPAPAQPLNRPVSARAASAQPAAQPASPAVSGAPRRRVAEVRLAQLARHARPDQESWFATALADAMETSFALAERIMMDVSGLQLATALIGLGAPAATIKSALESFFPHLAQPSQKHTLATDLIEELDADSCAARLEAWQRADSYTSGGATHVPALADSKPTRRDPFQRAAPKDTRKAATPRKAG